MKRVLSIVLLVVIIAAVLLLAFSIIWVPVLAAVLAEQTAASPTDKTRELLNNLYNQPETLKTAEDVTFTPNYTLSGLTLSERLPFDLGKSGICMSLGDYEEKQGGFSLTKEPYHKITWNGNSDKLVDVVVICNINREMLEDGFQGMIVEERNWKYDCSVCGEGRCCLVALKQT